MTEVHFGSIFFVFVKLNLFALMALLVHYANMLSSPSRFQVSTFSSTSRLMRLLNIDNIHFEQMVHRIYSAELQLNKTNASDTEAAILDLNLSIHNDTVSIKKYMINGMIFILLLLIFRSLMAMSLGVPLMVYICQSIFTC